MSSTQNDLGFGVALDLDLDGFLKASNAVVKSLETISVKFKNLLKNISSVEQSLISLSKFYQKN